MGSIWFIWIRTGARRSRGRCCPSHPAGRRPGCLVPPGLPGCPAARVAGRLSAAPAALADGLAAAGGSLTRPGGPRVLLLATLLAAEAATLLAAEAAAAVTALGLGDLGRRIPQRGADLVDLHLDDGALLAFLGLVGPGLQAAGDDDAGAAVERLGHVLRGIAPDRAAHEQGLPVLPLVALAVEGPRRGRDGEVGHGGAGRREPQLRVAGDVADDGDDGVASHGESSSLGSGLRRPGAAAWSAAPTR